jgi:phospholipid/cholesterol/gamma-HCH transport system ATP-binding protein
MTADQTVISVSHLAKTFGSKNVLRDVSFQVGRGERLAILGAGGSGKSTLLKIMLGIIPADHGHIELLGQNVFESTRDERQNLLRSVGMAFQQGALFDFMTVRENILFAMENMTNMSSVDMEERVHTMLNSVNLPNAAQKIPSQLSGGMRRRVGIVRALATNPQIALLDEPTAGLDPVTSRTVIDMIHNLGDLVGSSLICVTSSVEVAFSFATRVAILRNGILVADGDWKSLHAISDPWITHFLDVRGFKPDTTA